MVPSYTTTIDGTVTFTADASITETALTSTDTSYLTITSDDMSAAATTKGAAASTTSEPTMRRRQEPASASDQVYLPSAVVSSACSCLSIPVSTTTVTVALSTQVTATSITYVPTIETDTSTTDVSAFSTVNIISTQVTINLVDAIATATVVPTSVSTNIQTTFATSTTVVLKSNLLKSIESIVSSQSLQPFCSAHLNYAVHSTDVYTSVTATMTQTITTTWSTQTSTSFVYASTLPNTASAVTKRQAATLSTPTALGGYSDDLLSSACIAAVASPTGTLTNYHSVTAAPVTSTNTVSVIASASVTQTVEAAPGIMYDSSFELNNGSWNLYGGAKMVPKNDAYDGSHVLELSVASANSYTDAVQYMTGSSTASWTYSFYYQIASLPTNCVLSANTYDTTWSLPGPIAASTSWIHQNITSPADSLLAADLVLQCSSQATAGALVYVDYATFVPN
ncbi:hypothetical protein MBLNU459_g2671t1 [Dothideomycetes sp. NU459]